MPVPVDAHLVDLSAGSPDRLERLLDDGERRRADAFRFPELRHRYVVAHAALRLLLAPRAGRPADRLAFSRDCPHCGSPEHGKPQLDPYSDVRFNLSHAADRMLLAVADGAEVGADVELADRSRSVDDLARSTLTEREYAHVTAVEDAERTRRFLTLWTVKEAHLKCLGRGLAVPPQSVDGLDLVDRGQAVLLPEDGTALAAIAVSDGETARLAILERHADVG